MSDRMPGVPSLSVGKTVDLLSELFIGSLRGGMPVKELPSIMLWGPPGVGKSQAIRQVADRVALKTGLVTRVTDVRLLLFNPIDLRGIPTANADKTLAIWLRPQIFDMDPSPSVLNLLFLDELSAAPQSVQAAAYQIALDRTVGEHRLPDNCIVLAAGNRMSDRSVSNKMPKALANRLCHIEITGNFEGWQTWAVEKGIHEKVVGFLSFRQDALMGFDATREDVAFATPRSWEMVSRLLYATGGDLERAYPLIAGAIGTGMAVEFRTWCKIFRTLPKIEDIFEGRMPAVPTSPDALYALIASMTNYAREHKNDLSRIGNSVRYAALFPTDFSAVLMKNYMAIEPGYRDKLVRIPEFYRWLSTKGKHLNGAVT